MSRKINLWIFLCLLMSALNNLLPRGIGIEGAVCRVIVYALPTFIGALVLKGDGGFHAEYLGKKPKQFFTLVLPLFPAFLLTVLLISNMTSGIMANLGYQKSPMPEGNLFALIFVLGLLPAVGEEVIFRHLPLTVWGDKGKTALILTSALVFASSHLSVFQVPYALFSGVLFVMIDMASGSLLPSLIFHFMNNTCSIVLTRIANKATVDITPYVMIPLGVLSLFSVLWVIIKRREYREFFKPCFDSERKESFTASPYLFSAVFLALSILLLFS